MKATKHKIRVIIPDSHGAHIDLKAERAFIADLTKLRPEEIAMIGDHLDCGGVFSSHQRSYTKEIPESFDDDCVAANTFLDRIQKAAPDAEIRYLEGNHEAHIERWASRTFFNKKDADKFLERQGPAAVLGLKRRGIKYYLSHETYSGLTVPGAFKWDKCFYTHGISFSKHAADVHLARFGANVVFGHIHRSMSVIERTVTSEGHGAWCPGTLAKLQPLYRHTAPTSHSHGYGLQFVNKGSGRFTHINVPILGGESSLMEMVGAIASRGRK